MTVWQIVLIVYVIGTLFALVTRPKNPNEDYIDRSLYALVWFVYAQLIVVGFLLYLVEKLRRKEPAWTLHHHEDGSTHIVPGPKVDDE